MYVYLGKLYSVFHTHVSLFWFTQYTQSRFFCHFYKYTIFAIILKGGQLKIIINFCQIHKWVKSETTSRKKAIPDRLYKYLPLKPLDSDVIRALSRQIITFLHSSPQLTNWYLSKSTYLQKMLQHQLHPQNCPYIIPDKPGNIKKRKPSPKEQSFGKSNKINSYVSD